MTFRFPFLDSRPVARYRPLNMLTILSNLYGVVPGGLRQVWRVSLHMIRGDRAQLPSGPAEGQLSGPWIETTGRGV